MTKYDDIIKKALKLPINPKINNLCECIIHFLKTKDNMVKFSKTECTTTNHTSIISRQHDLIKPHQVQIDVDDLEDKFDQYEWKFRVEGHSIEQVTVLFEETLTSPKSTLSCPPIPFLAFHLSNVRFRVWCSDPSVKIPMKIIKHIININNGDKERDLLSDGGYEFCPGWFINHGVVLKTPHKQKELERESMFEERFCPYSLMWQINDLINTKGNTTDWVKFAKNFVHFWNNYHDAYNVSDMYRDEDKEYHNKLTEQTLKLINTQLSRDDQRKTFTCVNLTKSKTKKKK